MLKGTSYAHWAAGVVSLAAGHSLTLGNHSLRPHIPVWHHLILLIIIFIRCYAQEFLAGFFFKNGFGSKV